MKVPPKNPASARARQRRRAFRALVVTAAAWGAATAHAAPFAVMTLRGRVTGSGDPFTNVLDISGAGDSIDYQLWSEMADVGTVNSQNGGSTIGGLTLQLPLSGDLRN